LDKENKGFPNTFSLKNFIYIKEMKDKLFVVDYNLKPTNDKDIINNTEYNKKQDITNVNTENENLKRTYDHAFSNIKNKYQDIKKNKIMNTVSNSKCKETRLNNKRFQNLTEIFTANHYKVLYIILKILLKTIVLTMIVAAIIMIIAVMMAMILSLIECIILLIKMMITIMIEI